jgi:hypothetical protein
VLEPISPATIASFRGRFTNQKALQVLYPDFASKVMDSQIQLPTPDHGLGSSNETLTVILSETYWEDRQIKHVLLLASDWAKETCHGCGAPLIGAIFDLDNDIWKLEIVHDDFAALGSFGYPPPVHVVRIGPRKYGFMFTVDFSAQGALERSLFMYAPSGGQIKKMLWVPEVYVEAADLFNIGRRPVWVTSEFGFIKGSNPNYYDFTISLWGNGIFSPKFEKKIYSFDGSEYQTP